MRSEHDMQMLRDAVASATNPVFASTPNEVVLGYVDKYGADWRKHIANDIAAVSGIKPDSVLRRFRGGRMGGKPSAKTKAEYEQVGKNLPPIGRTLKGDSITISVKGTQGAGKKERQRSINVPISGARAQKFVDNPTYADLWDAYGADEGVFEDDDSSYLEVASVSAS